MTRLGAQWTMAMIMISAVLGVGYHKGFFSRGPAWPQAAKTGDPIVSRAPSPGQTQELAEEADLSGALDSALDRGANAKDTALDLPSASVEASGTTAPAPAGEPTTDVPSAPEDRATTAPAPAATRSEPERAAPVETVPPQAAVEPVRPEPMEVPPPQAREPARTPYVGSIRVPTRQAGQTIDDQVTAMRAAADLTPEQAGAEALAAIPDAVVTTITIGNENGYLVYRVHLAGEDGRVHDVLVDAGTGRVVLRHWATAVAARPRARVRTFVGNDDESGRPQ